MQKLPYRLLNVRLKSIVGVNIGLPGIETSLSEMHAGSEEATEANSRTHVAQSSGT